MIGMRIKAPLEFRRLKIIDAPGSYRVLAGRQRDDKARIGRMALVIDARQEAPDFVGAQQRPFMHTLRPAVGSGGGLRG